MLGVFRTKVVERVTNPVKQSALEDDLLEKHFDSYFDDRSKVYFGINGFIACNREPIYPGPLSQDFPLFPRCTVPSPGMHADGNYNCVIRSDDGVEIDTFIAAYNRAKARSYGTFFQFIKLRGRRNYNGILYDYASSVDPENTYTHAVVVNGFNDVPMYWGIDSEGSCIVTDVAEFVDKVCGTTYKCIPSGTCMLIRVPVSAAPASSSSGDSD
ncbi:unnamed protein product [Rhodiola kirilowii]